MLEDYEKKMSLLLDNELSVAESVELLQQIEKSEQLQLKWNRYNISSSILKSNIFPIVDLTPRLSRRLESEPIVLSPPPKKSFIQRGKAIAVTALAASIAAIGITTIAKMEEFSANKSTIPTIAATSPLPSVAPLPVVDSEFTVLDSRFNRYLFTHNESTYATGMQGILPYARVVSYEMSR